MKYMKSIIRFAALLLMMVCAQTAKAQMYIMVHKTDGNTLRIAVSDVDSVTFREWTGPIVSYEYVDLGLSVKWATCNIGATSPEQFGNYFAWGETQPKAEYTAANYKWYDATGSVLKYNIWKSLGTVDMKYRLDPDDDAAKVLLGDGWRIPTVSDFQELYGKCRMSLTEQNGVLGILFTSSVNNNSIFMPMAGEYWKGDTIGTNVYAYYSTDNLICYNEDESGYIYSFYCGEKNGGYRYGFYSYDRVGGLPIRPVYSPNEEPKNNVLEVKGLEIYEKNISIEVGETRWIDASVVTNSDEVYLQAKFISEDESVATVTEGGKLTGVSEGKCPIIITWGEFVDTCYVTVNDFVPVMEAVDLGLSVKWATCNIGASSPEKAGGQFAWGETQVKEEYSWNAYKYYDATSSSITKYGEIDGKTVLDPEDDAAIVNWGGEWRMPTNVEFQELLENCSLEWISYGDNAGYLVTSRVKGYEGNSIFLPMNFDYGSALYWTVNLSEDDEWKANVLYDDYVSSLSRSYGFNIRPVCPSDSYQEPRHDLTLSADTLTMYIGQTLRLVAYSDNKELYGGDVIWTSSDTSVVRLHPLGFLYAEGTGTSIVTASIDTLSAVCYVTVKGLENEPVDLGLSVKWGSYNLGAFSPEETGGYYAWGETEEKEYYYYDSYKWYDEDRLLTKYNLFAGSGTVDMKYRLDPDDDVAHVLLGDNWRMPTDYEFEELLDNCSWVPSELNGVKGFMVTSKLNGNSIFLPLTGERWSDSNYSKDEAAFYYSNTLSIENGNSEDVYVLYLYSYEKGEEYHFMLRYSRSGGLAIRPVYTTNTYDNQVVVSNFRIQDSLSIEVGQRSKIEVEYEIDDDIYLQFSWSSDNEKVATVDSEGKVLGRSAGTCVITGTIGDCEASCVVTVRDVVPVMESVDLGLSVEWATCNVGASRPEYTGGLYAWGETETKDEYEQYNYKWWSDSTGAITKYTDEDGKTILDPDDDVASVIWGKDWRMPTIDEFIELTENCDFIRTEVDGMYGYRVVSYINGNSIFLPDYPDNSELYYWSSTRSKGETARLLYEDQPYYNIGRYIGLLIRPVRPSEHYYELTLNADTLELVEGQTEILTAKMYGKEMEGNYLEWLSSDTSVVWVSENGGVTAVGEGVAIITASLDTLNAACFVTVKGREPVDEFVDLGLSVKWATCNVGASYPEQYGNYFAWGETEPYYTGSARYPNWKDGKESGYNWASNKYAVTDSLDNIYLTKYNAYSQLGLNGFIDNKMVLEAVDDAASANLGGYWRTPTSDEFQELVDNCNWETVEMYGVWGYLITSNVPGYEDKSIFMPFSGDYWDTELEEYEGGYYWTSSLYTGTSQGAYYFLLESQYIGGYYRYVGGSIRPVIGYSEDEIKDIAISRSELALALNAVSEIEVNALDENGRVLSLNGGLDITWTSDDESVATVENGVITAVGPGTCTITVVVGDFTAECEVVVEDPYDVEPESVDLGLSVNWATFNIGSFRPDMVGDFFAWGEVEPYYEAGYAESTNPVWKNGKEKGYALASYQWAEQADSIGKDYTMTKYAKDGKTVLDAADDVAVQTWGGEWRMPDQEEFLELMNKCSWEYVVEDGVKGYKITSNIEGYTDKSIFLPISESRSGLELYSDSEGYYWSRNVNSDDPTQAWYLYISEDYQSVWHYLRYQGRVVRPVCPSDNWQGITSLEFDSLTASLELGGTGSIAYIMLSGDEDYSFMKPTSWSSSDESVVTVDENGILRGIKVGTATITAQYDELTAECLVTVSKLSDIDPEQALEAYNAMYVQLGTPNSCGYNKPDDYGLISVSFSNDIEAADLFLPNSGYNWYSVCGELTSRSGNYRNAAIRYNACYNVISAANKVLNAYDEESDDPEVQAMIGEAHAIRAFAYLNLAPYYQVSYTSSADAKNLPCVPLLTHESDPKNNPRATVQEVYNQIVSDLNAAIDKLNGWERSDKSRIDQQVAYGLRARAYLNMGMWSEAAADAAVAMRGFEPASMYDVSTPFLYDINESNWIWGYDMTEEIASINTYATSSGWLRSFSGDGYATACQTYSMINSDLYDMIPSSDVRKGWWVNEDLTSPLLNRLSWDNLKGQDIASGYIDGVKEQFLPYTNVKFGMNYLGNTANDEDWCWMRAEEMILIRVEGLAKSGNADAASQLLTSFVTTYRDPDYDINARGLSLEDEIWFQRRVELWGEGFSNNDTRRLNKPLVRFHENKENNCPYAFRLNMSADNGWWLLRFPATALKENAALVDNVDGEIPEPGVTYDLLDGVTDYCDNGGGYDDEPYLSIYPRKLDMYAGDIYSLSFRTNTGETVVWTSSDDNVATVDKYGVVTAVAEGYCTITATAGELSAECGVVVMPEYHDTVSAVYDFIISEDSLAARFYYIVEGDLGYEISAEFGESDSGVVCTSFIYSITLSSADEAQEVYANMTAELTDEFIDSLNVVFNDEGTGFSYTNPRAIGMDRDAVLAMMRQAYNSMIGGPEGQQEGPVEYEEPGYIGKVQAFLPAEYADSNAVAAWYQWVDEQENSVKYEAVFLFEDGSLVVTKSKFYTKADGRNPELEILATGRYELTDGDFYNGVPSVVLSDGRIIDVEIQDGVLYSMGEAFEMQDNEDAPQPMHTK